jgi:UDP-glucose 4-epimerase
MTQKILVTGGLGYIGSHTCINLIEAGYHPIILDNLCASKSSVFDRIKRIKNGAVDFIEGDIRDASALNDIFKTHDIKGVIHFAALKAVGESIEQPLDYFDNNIGGTMTLLKAMKDSACNHIIFSSSANVYGNNNPTPNTEDMPTGNVTNPYGRTKHMIELMLRDYAASSPDFSAVILRYFNPIGAHESGIIGEDPLQSPSNVFPLIAKVAKGEMDSLTIFGDDYDTPDGTGMRDFIHVVDLADGHIECLTQLSNTPGTHIYNLGTGRGSTVMELINTYEKASGQPIAYKIAPRREGDIAKSYADVSKIKSDLGWSAKRNINDACIDSWRWINDD